MMKLSILTKLIVTRLVPAAVLVVAALLHMRNYDQPWLIVGVNLSVLFLFILLNALAIKRLDEERTRTVQLKEKFTAMVSHELRTPLATIKVAVDLLADGVDGPVTDAQRKRLEMTGQSVSRLNRLIDNVLDFQKLESGRIDLTMTPVNLGQVLRKTAVEFRPVADEKGIRIVEAIPADLPMVQGNEDLITQVAANLINNAIKFSDRGVITVSCKCDGKNIMTSIQDQGIGIHEDDFLHLFQVFSQIPGPHKVHHGSGLGLAISKQIVERHGGKMGVESVYGQGSTFFFSLPQVL